MAGPHWIGSLDMDQQHWGAIFTPDERLDGGIGTWNAIMTLGAGVTMTLGGGNLSSALDPARDRA